MQKFLSLYATAAHLALLAIAPLFLSPFCSSATIATVLLWLSVPTVLWVFFEPSRRTGEMPRQARARVARSVLRDPLIWIFVALTICAFVRWMNTGIGLAYDIEKSAWAIREQALVFFPGCVEDAGRLPFATLVALTILYMGCRHSLGKKARTTFLSFAAGNAALTVLVFLTAQFFEHKGVTAFLACSLKSASYPGSAFGVWSLVGIIALVSSFDCGRNKWTLPIAFATCASLAGLYFFAPTPVILLYLIAAIVLLALACLTAGLQLGATVTLKCLALMLIALTIPVLCVLGLASEELNTTRLAPFAEGGAIFDTSFAPMREALSRIASKVWMEQPWLGTGLGSFSFDIRFHATDADWKILLPGQAVAINGWWYLLAERGIIGALFYALVILAFVILFSLRLVGAIRRSFFIAPCLLAFVLFAVLAVEALIDTSFLRSDVTLAVGACLALACSSLPDPKVAKKKQENE